MDVLGQGLRVLVVGVLLGAAAVVVRDLPDPAPEESAFCAPEEVGGSEAMAVSGTAASEAATRTAPPSDHSAPGFAWVNPAEARQLLDEGTATFVDARSAEEYQTGHVAGSLHVPLDDGVLPPRATGLLEGSRTVVAYCDSTDECALSIRLAALLSSEGFRDVRVLEGGLPAWLDAGLPSETSACTDCP